jgi:ADP-heptose:LPS heptosyltransferase
LLNHTTILQLIWLIRRARFVVSVDSGPTHIAAAVSDRLASIHTWTDPQKVGPYNSDAWVWKGGELWQVRDLPAPADQPKSRLFKPADVKTLLPLIQKHLR